LAFAQGKNDNAIILLRGVADKQDIEGKGEVALPAREVVADMLLEMGRPEEALVEYEKSMRVDPNRFNGLYGAARSVEASGQAQIAARYYAQFMKNCEDSKSVDRAELTRARAVLVKN